MSNNTQRYEVVAPMPHFTHLMAGDILVPKYHTLYGDCWGMEDEEDVHKWITFCPDYPHLFRLLKWWEGLAVDELPKYVKSINTDVVAKVEYKFDSGKIYARNILSHNWHILHYYSDGLHPATEAEYNDYLTKLNGK